VSGGAGESGGEATDEELAARCAAGDRGAADDLARRHLPQIARLVRRYVKTDDADDVAQRAMMRAIESVASFRGDSAFRSWLHRIAVNTALNHVRSAPRDRAHRTIDEADLITDTLGTARLVAREAKSKLLVALADLPPKQRASVELRLFEDRSFREVGDALGTSEDSAKANFHHGMKRLREVLVGST
jgi:RNA polymerase sigma-70 factor (ECF subfamily)